MGIVNDYWQENMTGTLMYRVVVKMKKLKKGLKLLHKAKFSNIENECMLALTKLNAIQKFIHTQPMNIVFHQQENEVMHEYQRLNKARMSYLQQRAKAERLKGGDKNTSYFHACLNKRRMHNPVYRIQNLGGV